jgi:hypothetical protein
MGVMLTAWRRPEYLSQTLDSWSRARGVSGICQMTIALGWADRETFERQAETVDAAKRALGCKVRIKPDSAAARAANGMGYAIAEAVTALFDNNPSVQFVIAGEEDIVVSDDVLEYFSWAAGRFADDRRVLLVNGHDEGGQGWDKPGAGALNGDADQYGSRLNQVFNPWCWGTWRDRWTRVLRPQWDWGCDSGGMLDSGHDWHIATRIIPRGGWLCVTPEASRSQNIGQHGGWAADPANFEATLSAAFREHREPGEYQVTEAAERAA